MTKAINLGTRRPAFKQLLRPAQILRQLKLWHLAPLCLPLLLGSTHNRAVSVAPQPTPNLSTQVLIERELAKFRATQPLPPSNTPLPSQTLTAFSKPSPQPPSAAPGNASPPPSSPSAPSQPQRPRTAQPRPAKSPQASLAALVAPQPAQNLPPIPLRVAVVRKAKTLTVATSDSGILVNPQGQIVGKLTAEDSLSVVQTPTGLQVGTWTVPSGSGIRPRSANGLVFVDGRWYRGSVELISQDDGLYAVNHVDLESYLYSVVGSEMPASWPLEALKAQAVTARSYALVHMVRHGNDPNYDLGATPRWQAYNGVESETNTTQAAVDATRGVLLSYQGGVVESLYASSIDIVQEVHGGFGMSQEGANQLAQQNFTYPQILAHFYPGTSLSVLKLN